jgi:hypothetical protein
LRQAFVRRCQIRHSEAQRVLLGRVLDEVEHLAPDRSCPERMRLAPQSKSFVRSSKFLARTNKSRTEVPATNKCALLRLSRPQDARPARRSVNARRHYRRGLRAKLARQAWQKRRWRKGEGGFPFKTGASGVPFKTGASPVTDPAEQLRLVMGARFEKRRLLSRSEAYVLYAAEKAINAADLKWRVMAQVSLGEVLSSPDARAYSAINSKRVDLLIVSHSGDPIAAIEYQGHGHYQGTAAARDAVKKEALRKAGVRYIAVTPESGTEDMAREISRMAQAELAAAPPARP